MFDCSVAFDEDDGRPAFIADDGDAIEVDGFIADRGSSSLYDVGFRQVSDYAVTNSWTTDGDPLRIEESD